MAIYEFMCKECLKITCGSYPITSNVKKVKCGFCGKMTAEKIISSNTFHLKGKKWAAKGKEGY